MYKYKLLTYHGKRIEELLHQTTQNEKTRDESCANSSGWQWAGGMANGVLQLFHIIRSNHIRHSEGHLVILASNETTREEGRS